MEDTTCTGAGQQRHAAPLRRLREPGGAPSRRLREPRGDLVPDGLSRRHHRRGVCGQARMRPVMVRCALDATEGKGGVARTGGWASGRHASKGTKIETKGRTLHVGGGGVAANHDPGVPMRARACAHMSATGAMLAKAGRWGSECGCRPALPSPHRYTPSPSAWACPR